MPDIKISALPGVSALSEADYLDVVQNGANRRASGGQLVELAGSGRNMLINCGVPINQDVFAGGALAAGAYGYDMWKAGAGGCNISIGADGLFSHASGPLQQVVESPEAAWGQALTFSVEDPSGTISISVGGATGSITAGSGRRGVTLTPVGSGDMIVQLTATNATYRQPKLERGRVATRTEFRPKGLELLLCQRYYEKSFNQAIRPQPNVAASFASGMVLDYVFAGTTYRRFIQCKVPKRAGGGVVVFNPQAANNQVRVRDQGDCISTVTYASEGGFVIECGLPAGVSAPAELWFHWVFNARI